MLFNNFVFPNVSLTLIDLMKENCFTLKNSKSNQYYRETMTDANYVNDLVLLINTPVQDKSPLLRQEQTAGGIGLYMNVNKMEFKCLKQEAISTLSGKPLKLVV